VAVVKEVAGTVEMRTAVGQPWTAVKVGQELPEGGDLRTGFRAKCTLAMDKNVTQVEALSVIRLGELRRDGETLKTRIYLKQGNTRSDVDKGGPKNDFAVVTPSATLSVRGTLGIQCGFFPAFGGNYGLGQAGLLSLINNQIGNTTGVKPGEQTNDQALPPGQVLAQQFLPPVLDSHAFEKAEQNAAQRWNTSTGAPAALSGTPVVQVAPPPPPPPPPPQAPPQPPVIPGGVHEQN
jgi:hypothetical protein